MTGFSGELELLGCTAVMRAGGPVAQRIGPLRGCHGTETTCQDPRPHPGTQELKISIEKADKSTNNVWEASQVGARQNMIIQFTFDADKAAQAMAYLVSRLVGKKTDKIKLIKLLYLADRDHFLQEGMPITGGDQYAMPHGPVPSLSLDLLDGQFGPGEDGNIFAYLQTQNCEVALKDFPTSLQLSKTELRVLDDIIDRYGATETWTLVRFTHQLPEYLRAYRPGTSTRIPFELILEIYSNGKLFRHNRPVITPAMAANMTCPFPRSEPDL